MANKRTFGIRICDSDAFLEMPLSAQALYFHLSLRVTKGTCMDKAERIARYIGASEDDLKVLIAKGFVACTETGEIMIKR